MIKRQPCDNKSILHRPALTGNARLVGEILSEPGGAALVHRADQLGHTCLHAIASTRLNQNHIQLCNATAVTNLCLLAGANPNAQTRFHLATPAHIAAKKENYSVLIVLAQHPDTDFTLHNREGTRPVDLLPPDTNIHREILRLTNEQEQQQREHIRQQHLRRHVSPPPGFEAYFPAHAQSPASHVTPPPGFEGHYPEPRQDGTFVERTITTEPGHIRQQAQDFAARLTQAHTQQDRYRF